MSEEKRSECSLHREVRKAPELVAEVVGVEGALVPNEVGAVYMWHNADQPIGTKLYAIPEGWVLVPVVLPKEVTQVVNKGHGYPLTPLQVWWKWIMQAMGHLPSNPS